MSADPSQAEADAIALLASVGAKFVTEYGVVCCTSCKGVPRQRTAKELADHFGKRHKVSQDGQRVLMSSFNMLLGMHDGARKRFDRVYALPQEQPVPALPGPPVVDGKQCLLCEAENVITVFGGDSLHKASMRHLRQVHNRGFGVGLVKDVKTQRVHTKRTLPPYLVGAAQLQDGADDVVVGRGMSAEWCAVQAELAAVVEPVAPTHRESAARSQMTPLVNAIGSVEERRALAAAVRGLCVPEALKKALLRFLCWFQRQRLSYLVRNFVINIVREDMNNASVRTDDSFNDLDLGSLDEYAMAMAKVLLLVKDKRVNNESPIAVTNLVNNAMTLNNPQNETQLRDAVMAALGAVFRDIGNFECALGCPSAVLAVRACVALVLGDDGVVASYAPLTKVCSYVIRFIRVWALVEAEAVGSRGPAGAPWEQVRLQLSGMLRPLSNSCFAALHDVRRASRRVQEEAKVVATVVWDTQRSKFQCGTVTATVVDWREMVVKVVAAAEDEASALLEKVRRFLPAGLELPDSDFESGTMCDNSQNGSLQEVCSDAFGAGLPAPDAPHPELCKELAALHQLQKFVVSLLVLTGGSAARGTEHLSLLAETDGDERRAVYIAADRVRVFFRWHKLRNREAREGSAVTTMLRPEFRGIPQSDPEFPI